MKMTSTSKIKQGGLALAAALTLSLPAMAQARLEQPLQLAQTSTTIERSTTTTEGDPALLPDMSPNRTETNVYRSETLVDDNAVDENDAEVAGISITTMLIFTLLAFAVVAIVVALSRRERSVV